MSTGRMLLLPMLALVPAAMAVASQQPSGEMQMPRPPTSDAGQPSADAGARADAAGGSTPGTTAAPDAGSGAKAQSGQGGAGGGSGGGAQVARTTEFLLANQGSLRWGAGLSLLRLSFSRREDEPGRMRNYVPRLERIAPEIGFQFAYSPPGKPWRLRGREGVRSANFQFMSVGGAVLVRLSEQDVSRGGISLAAVLGFFEDRISLGMGFDIYRGIAVADADGARGSSTVYTGLAAWGLAREGELTPENVFVVLSLNLAALGGQK